MIGNTKDKNNNERKCNELSKFKSFYKVFQRYNRTIHFRTCPAVMSPWVLTNWLFLSMPMASHKYHAKWTQRPTWAYIPNVVFALFYFLQAPCLIAYSSIKLYFPGSTYADLDGKKNRKTRSKRDPEQVLY